MWKIDQGLWDMDAGAESVGFAGAEVRDSSAERIAKALKQNKTLRVLHLSGQFIGDVGAAALAEALRHNCTLQELWLDCNDIGNTGARALEEALQQNWVLQELGLCINPIDQDLERRIQALVTRNKEACIIMQVTTMPSRGVMEDNAFDVVVTKMSGEEVFRLPLQPETTLRLIAVEVAELCRAPLTKLRWVLPGPRTVGAESLDEPLFEEVLAETSA